MFTGIIEEIGKLKKITKRGDRVRITINADNILKNVALGDSISVNGVCLTVTAFNLIEFDADISMETYEVTTFKELRTGDLVNLELALAVGSRFGGHIVSGHVDGNGILNAIKRVGDGFELEFKTSEEFLKKTIEKGSVAIDGISLTVFKITKSSFTVACIPHTFKNTNLRNKKIGSRVNLENDLVGKYLIKGSQLSIDKGENLGGKRFESRNESQCKITKGNNEDSKKTIKSKITMSFLSENGFL